MLNLKETILSEGSLIEKKPFYKRWWFYAIIAFIIIGVITSPSAEEQAKIDAEEAAVANVAKEKSLAKEKAKADEKKAEADAKKAEKEAIDAAIVNFTEATKLLVSDSNGVITDADIKHLGAHYKVNVYVDEAAWAASSDSEKESFATTIGTAVQKSLPDTTIVDFRSAVNDDVVAEGKLLGGYDIKR